MSTKASRALGTHGEEETWEPTVAETRDNGMVVFIEKQFLKGIVLTTFFFYLGGLIL